MAKDGTGWKDIPMGGLIVEAGNAAEYATGGWRAFRPIWDADRCIHCMQCWVFCPDSSIFVKDGKMTGIDLVHCKGCARQGQVHYHDRRGRGRGIGGKVSDE
jgi:pyruvate ferredoxin oxidoreductase delta subunit